MASQVPNLISVARLAIAPAAILSVLQDKFDLAFWLLLVAAASDAIDGILARWLDARTLLGSYLDPAADKALLVGLFIALGHEGVLPIWLVSLVVLRDLAIVAGFILLHELRPRAAKIEPLVVSKVNTATQLALTCLALAAEGFDLDAGWLVGWLVWAAAATTVLSWAGYGVMGIKRLVRPVEAS